MKKYIYILSAIIMLNLLSLPALSQDVSKLRIAILDFTNTGGLEEQETITLTNRLRSMLVQSNAYIVLERGKMEEILNEQGFQQSGCTTTECAVEMGQLLNVQKMVSGSIGKIGDTYTIDLSLLDVETAQIEKSFFRDYKGEIDGLLEIIQVIANQITEAHANQNKQTVRLSVKSDPVSARVLLNERYYGETPLSVDIIKGTDLNIRLQKENYKDWQIKITPDKDTDIEAELVGKADESSGISSTWYWIGGGVALVGAAAVLLLSGSDGNKTSNDYPLPPARP